MSVTFSRILRGTVLVFALPTWLPAQERYHEPLPAIARILSGQAVPAVLPSLDGSKLLLMEQPGLPPLSLVAVHELQLAGVRINPRNNAPSRERTYSTMIVQPVGGGDPRRIVIPWNSRVGMAMWAPDASKVAFTLVEEGGVSLWLADASSGAIRLLYGPNLNAAFGSPCRWMPSGGALICARIPAGRTVVPESPRVPSGPTIEESNGKPGNRAGSEALLGDASDEALFEHYFTDQLVLIPLSGSDRLIGPAGLHASVRVSPDGRYLLVQTLHRPFSRTASWRLFPRRTEVWDMSGAVVRVVGDAGLEETSGSPDGTRRGPRQTDWVSDQPATLSWVEAQDGGDGTSPSKFRDRINLLGAPFSADPTTLADFEYRVEDITWGGKLAVVSERWPPSRLSRIWVVERGKPGSARLLVSGSSEGSADLVTRTSPGGAVLLTSKDGRFVFQRGAAVTSDGGLPFLDRLDLSSGKSLRLWQSESPGYEEAVMVLDPDQGKLITRREGNAEVPNYYLRDLRKRGSAQLTRITNFADPAPEFAGLTKQVISYQRGDGARLSATLYLPPGYDRSKGALPFLIWTGGLEQQTKGPVSPNQFVRPTGASPLFLLLAGYGVLENPSLPVVAMGNKPPNDSYVEQLVAGAEAAVAKLVSMGVADPKRIGIGGESSGAAIAANLLAHSDLFTAGITMNGSYDQTRTPFGFAGEPRSYWQASEVYNRMSPINFADKIKEPLLLLQGIPDERSSSGAGESQRLYAAVTGNGGNARLVLLPGETSSYRARESVGHALYEMVSWMDKYVGRRE